MRTGTKLCFIAAFVFTAAVSAAPAGTLKGEKLLAMLEKKTSNDLNGIVEKTHAMGYLTGLLEALVMMNDIDPEKQLFCLPASGISAGEAKDLIVDWLKEHPKKQDEQARILVLYFLQDQFPCSMERSIVSPRTGAPSQ